MVKNSMKILLYPSAGKEDWKIAFEQFIEKVDKFIFADINYNLQDLLKFKKHLSSIGVIDLEEIIGSFDEAIQVIDNGDERYKDMKPAYYKVVIKYKNDLKTVIFRKGFGQYALNELDDNSLYCFYHRGDGQGECGSDVFYLGNRNMKHKPIGKLFNLLIKKLANKSLIISDGSNTDSKILKTIYRKISNLKKDEVLKNLVNTTAIIYGTKLKCTDVLDYRYNHTLVWGVSK